MALLRLKGVGKWWNVKGCRRRKREGKRRSKEGKQEQVNRNGESYTDKEKSKEER